MTELLWMPVAPKTVMIFDIVRQILEETQMTLVMIVVMMLMSSLVIQVKRRRH